MLTLVHYPAGFPLDKAYITPEHRFAETGCLSATIVDTEFRHCCLRRDCAGWHHGHHDRYYVYHRNNMPPKSHLFPKCARSSNRVVSAYPANAPRLQGRRERVDEVAYWSVLSEAAMVGEGRGSTSSNSSTVTFT